MSVLAVSTSHSPVECSNAVATGAACRAILREGIDATTSAGEFPRAAASETARPVASSDRCQPRLLHNWDNRAPKKLASAAGQFLCFIPR